MRRALIIAFVLTNFGVCPAAFAATPDGCRSIFAGCMKACSKDEQCQSNCYEGVGFCLMWARQGNKPFFRDAATAVGAISAPATTSGAKNVNSGNAATATIKSGAVATQTVNTGAAATATINAPALSAPAKPPIAQPGRSNIRAQ